MIVDAIRYDVVTQAWAVCPCSSSAMVRIAVETIQGEARPWEDLPEALSSPAPKPVFVRARVTHA